MPRPWSARMRCAFVASGESPYATPRLGGDPLHDVLEPVGVVHRGDVLEDAGGALEPHPGVDVLRGKRRQRPVGALLERHEDQVPELEEALAARAARRAVGVPATDLLAPVPEDLRVRAARSRPADRPEVLGARERDDPLRRHADVLPELDRHLVRPEVELRVARVHGHPDPIPVEPHALAHELGRELDRALLEVLAEREVSEHLEERQVVRVEPDVVDVRRPEDLLRRRGERRRRLLEPQEVRHLRLHSGARQQRRVVVRARDERRRGHAQVALLLEEREESLAQFGRRPHHRILRAGQRAAGRSTRPAARREACAPPTSALLPALPPAALRPPSPRRRPPRRRASTSAHRRRGRSPRRGR